MAHSSPTAISHRRDRASTPMLLAGWLFADLALALVVILLATSTDFPAAAVAPSPTPSPEPSPTPSTAPVTEGVRPEPVVVRIRSDARALLARSGSERRKVVRAIRNKLEPYHGEQAAFVLTWGASPTYDEGGALARIASRILKDAVPELIAGAGVRDLWQGTSSGEYRRGELIFEIYLSITG